MHPLMNGIGEYITTAVAIAGTGTVTSGTVVTGEVIDRFATRSLYQSAKLAVGYTLTLASGVSATARNIVEHSDDNSDWTEFDHPYASGVASITGLNSGAAQKKTVEFNVNLAGAKRYIRNKTSITASGTLSAQAGLWIFGGGEFLPAGE